MEHSDALNSWKEISNYVGRGVRTVQRWEKDFALPVRRPCGHLRGSVIAMKSEVDDWLQSREAREAQASSNGHDDETSAAMLDAELKLLRAALEQLVGDSDRLKERIEILEGNISRLKEESGTNDSKAAKKVSSAFPGFSDPEPGQADRAQTRGRRR